MSMLTFYINRGGHTLSEVRKRKLERAKDELRALFGKAARPHVGEASKTPAKAAAKGSR